MKSSQTLPLGCSSEFVNGESAWLSLRIARRLSQVWGPVTNDEILSEITVASGWSPSNVEANYIIMKLHETSKQNHQSISQYFTRNHSK
jgi:hypothetical protein